MCVGKQGNWISDFFYSFGRHTRVEWFFSESKSFVKQHFVLFYVLRLCKCVLYYWQRLSTQLQLTDISITRDHAIRKSSIFRHLWPSVAHECEMSSPWFISLPQHYACIQFLTLLALHFPLPKVIKRCLTYQTLQLQGTGVREEREDQHFTGWSTQEEGLGTGVWGNVVDYGKILWWRCCSSPGFLLEDSDMY